MRPAYSSALVGSIPLVFVVLWSTGFIGARMAMPHADPFSFLSLRFVATIALLGGFALAARVAWPRGPGLWAALGVGALIHAVYLGSVFWAVKHGFPAGFAGLIVGLQPVVTAILAGALLGERVTGRQAMGLGVGLAGVAMVLLPGIEMTQGGDMIVNAMACAVGVAAFSLGTVIQKAAGGTGHMAANSTVQYLGALVISAPMALLFEPLVFVWTGELVFALFWLVLVLSIGAIGLLMIMIKAGEVARVASLFYLVPSVTALMAFALFGERLNLVQGAGIVVTSAGVALAMVRRRPRSNRQDD